MVCTDSAHAKRKSHAKLSRQLFVYNFDFHRVKEDVTLHATESMIKYILSKAWQ